MMERITVSFETKQVTEDNEEGVFRFEGMASTFGNVDLQGDIIEQGAFGGSLERLEQRAGENGGLMPILFSHDPGAPLGVFTTLQETDDGLFAKGEMPLDDTFVAGRIVPQMKAGSLRAMSIGFQIDERRFEGDIRIIEKVTLWEASLVVFPANPRAQVMGIKNNRITSDDILDLHRRDVESMLRDGVPLSARLAKKVVTLLAADLRHVDEPQPAPRNADAKDTGELSVWDEGLDALLSGLKGIDSCPNSKNSEQNLVR